MTVGHPPAIATTTPLLKPTTIARGKTALECSADRGTPKGDSDFWRSVTIISGAIHSPQPPC
ncbi:hypothetical protein NON20_22140 [Synechocystis sp. B12]|nr:hypothetical protein NON20_22140 [Synechocystis sp. B12]